MHIKDIAPWKRNRDPAASEGEQDQFRAMQRHMNETFDNFFRRFSLAPWEWSGWRGEYSPRVNVTEKDNVVHVEAEVPGMEEKDLDVSLSDNMLTLKGERRTEAEDSGERYYRREISYGAFHRSVPLPGRVQEDSVKATFSKGVLRIELPLAEGRSEHARKIDVTAE